MTGIKHLYHLPPVSQLAKSQFTQPVAKKAQEDAPEDAESEDNSQAEESAATPLTYLRREQIEQLNLAGLAIDEPIPAPPFPAAPADYKSHHSVITEAKRHLKELNPPIHTFPQVQPNAVKANTLREQHLGVINTLVHKCLQTGDYERASRAWGLLLRALPDGTDLRKFGRWGIGAEILLRRKTDQSDWRESSAFTDTSHGSMDIDDDPEEEEEEDETWISDANLEAAKAYYQKLIVRYPPTRNINTAKRVSLVNLYPAFFSIWIYQITQRSRKAKRRILDKDVLEIDAIRLRELRAARELAEQFDTVIQNDPWDKNAELLKLRAMVSQWIADLLPPDVVRNANKAVAGKEQEAGKEVPVQTPQNNEDGESSDEESATQASSRKQSSTVDTSSSDSDSDSEGDSDSDSDSEVYSNDEETQRGSVTARDSSEELDDDRPVTSSKSTSSTDDSSDDDEDGGEGEAEQVPATVTDRDARARDDDDTDVVQTQREKELENADKLFREAQRYTVDKTPTVRTDFFLEYPNEP